VVFEFWNGVKYQRIPDMDLMKRLSKNEKKGH
jgi:hypothetical protein